MEIVIELPSAKALRAEMKAVEKETQTAVQRAIKDTASRAPAQVTKAVTAVYGIKSSEVTAAGKAAKGGAKTVGKIKVSGVTAETLHLIYSGRPLTLTHFSMTPKSRPEGNRKYTVKASVMKGKKTAYPGAFIAPGHGGVVLAFERKDKSGKETKRYPIQAIKRTSIPQMIESEEVSTGIKEKIDAILVERINHHTERALQKRG